MKLDLQDRLTNRTGLVVLMFGLTTTISMLGRIVLLIKSFSDVDFTVVNFAGIFVLGLLYDIVCGIYFSLPFIIYLWLVPERIFHKKLNKSILYVVFFLVTFLLLTNEVAEWFFWDEFSSRFNFIAVDYLVYTTEVIGNIMQSYPMEWIVPAIGVAALSVVIYLRRYITVFDSRYIPFKKRSMYFGLYVGLFAFAFLGVNSKLHHFSSNEYVNELAGNGLYELFAAYRNNELDYERFYKDVPNEEAFRSMRTLIQTPESKFTGADPFSIEGEIVHQGKEKRMNVVLISVESFSAEFMTRFGSKAGITPFLDSLSDHSLVFTNLYATGTRTVRGLEALSLCVPPTPGQSIVRRPENEGLFSLGKVFQEKGYKSQYIYGGYGYFDNMNYFFSNNSYDVVDRTALKDSEVTYENIWGVADENLFDLALREIGDNSKEKPVFAHVMTTSNHRPFTYPDGRIDIPSHTSREGAVKYTDCAIGQFIRKASATPWFHNTLFIIVADHCASSAGKTELPVEKYHIPMLIYSPGNIEPGEMNRLMSQIDIGPTVLGLLNFSYTSKFYGYDIFQLEPGRERAFISTYQSLGYLKDNKLVVLSPQKKAQAFTLTNHEREAVATDPRVINEAVIWYQAASYSFKHGLME